MDVLEERKTLIRQLQTQLRNEEMSLVLLKKIRQSQVLAEQAKEASKVSIQPAVQSSQRSSQQNSNQHQHHRGTPPLPSSGTPKARLGSSTQPNASGKQPGVKSVLTPDLSHLKPVSVVSSFMLDKSDIHFEFSDDGSGFQNLAVSGFGSDAVGGLWRPPL